MGFSLSNTPQQVLDKALTNDFGVDVTDFPHLQLPQSMPREKIIELLRGLHFDGLPYVGWKSDLLAKFFSYDKLEHANDGGYRYAIEGDPFLRHVPIKTHIYLLGRRCKSEHYLLLLHVAWRRTQSLDDVCTWGGQRHHRA